MAGILNTMLSGAGACFSGSMLGALFLVLIGIIIGLILGFMMNQFMMMGGGMMMD